MMTCNHAKCRKMYYLEHDINDISMIKCSNPCCNNYGIAKNMQLHHIWCIEIAKELMYNVKNMALICLRCHNALHKGWKVYYSAKGQQAKQTNFIKGNKKLM